jgi:hypothetical protein
MAPQGDLLIGDVRLMQNPTGTGLTTHRTVVRVVEHRPGGRQLPLLLHCFLPARMA